VQLVQAGHNDLDRTDHRKLVERDRAVALIVGGFILEDGSRAFFGVKLNLAWPPRFEK